MPHLPERPAGPPVEAAEICPNAALSWDPVLPSAAMTTTSAPTTVNRQITVVRGPLGRPGRRLGGFSVATAGDRLHIGHDLPDEGISEAVIPSLARDLLHTGVLRTVEEFHDVVTALVTSREGTWQECWSAYYRASMTALAAGLCPFSPVHDRAVAEMAGHSALEIGCCFGFLSLRLARGGVATTACDIDPSVLRLLATCAPAGAPVPTPICLDARSVPLAGGRVDTVYLVHVLEHLDAASGWDILREALRLARRRVVIAVPFEEVAVAQYGHVRTFDLASLARLAREVESLGGDRATGYRTRVDEHHGGWLVVDL